ncbi:hypothetical protein JCM10207_002135 [Rhodosporidiobolus poonsookiae]
MAAQQPRITLRPPPHRDYLTGYPGIPASDPSNAPAYKPDPISTLPLLLRPQAELTGTVEIRAPVKGPPVRARWLSVELEKIETVPPAPSSIQPDGAHSKKEAPVKVENRFVELIGTGPARVWEVDTNALSRARSRGQDSPRKKGFRGLLKGRGVEEEDEDDGYDIIPDGNYPFKIPLPEGLPPTIEVDSKLNGVSYQIVASLCCKGKKPLLKGIAKPAVFVSSASILLDKADLLSWPIYQPILPTPLPPKLPWAAPPGEPTAGETREGKYQIRRDDGTSGEIWMKATRPSAAFGPGDAVQVFAQVGWGGDKPIHLTRLDFVLRETITFRYPSPSNVNYIIRAPGKVSTLFQANASISSDPSNPSAFAVLYPHEPVAFDLTGLIPPTHTRVTVRTAKHVEVSYHLKIRGMVEGGDEVAIDNWPVVLSTVGSRVGKGIMAEIGWVEGLCDRPGAADGGASVASPPPAEQPAIATGLSPSTPSESALPYRRASPPPQARPPPAPSPVLERSHVDSATEKARLLNGSLQPATTQFRVTNPTEEPSSPPFSHLAPKAASAPLVTPSPVRPSYSPVTAEEEKRRYYEQATRSRDLLQSSVQSPQATSPTSPETDFSPRQSMVDDDFAVQQAAVIRREEVQRGVSRERELSYGAVADDDYPLSARPSHLAPTRSNTTAAWSGSTVSTALPPDPPSPRSVAARHSSTPPTSPGSSFITAALGRTLTTAEAEKRRLFLDAKETARRRQEEARLELERQNNLLAEMEWEEARKFEEAQNAFEDSLIAEAEAAQRDEERRQLEAFEAEQRGRIRAEEEAWEREERLRQQRALAELDARKRRAEQAVADELRRFAKQQRAAEQAREEDIARQAAERKAEDDMKRAKAEELKRQDAEREREEEERRLAASRKAEMERQRAEDERRRLEGEQARLAEAARRQREEAEAHARAEAEARARYETQLAAANAEEAARHHHEQEEQARRQDEQEEQARQAQHELLPAQEASRPAYPTAASPAQHIVGSIRRAPSVASFAPSTSAVDADANFYARALAAQAGVSEEKAAYLRQLRQREEERRGNLPAPIPQRRPSQSRPIKAYTPDPSAQAHLYHGYHAQPTYPEPPSDPRSFAPTGPAYLSFGSAARPPFERYDTAPTNPIPPPVPALPSVSEATSSTATYKTAAEEKEEAAARRRAEDARGKQVAIPEEDELPPSYPVPNSSAPAERTAAEEKAELERYYSAKAAVDAHEQARQAPPPPPSRSDTYYSATPIPSYQPSGAPAYPTTYGNSTPVYTPPPPQHDGPAYPSHDSTPTPTLTHGAHHTPQRSESSHEMPRDPSIAAGKRAQRQASFAASGPQAVEQLSPYAAHPASSTSLPPQQTAGYAYVQPEITAPLRLSYNDERARQEAHGALGDLGFGSSFQVESFPKFDRLAEQIAAKANGHSA